MPTSRQLVFSKRIRKSFDKFLWPAEITIYEGSNSNERKIFVCDQGANKINAYDINGTLLFTIPSLPKVKGIAVFSEPKISMFISIWDKVIPN